MNKPSHHIRTKKELAEDLLIITEKRKLSWSYRRIAEYINSLRDYNLGHEVYFRQYSALTAKIVGIAAANREELIQLQLSEIAELKTELFNSWLKSKGQKEIKTIKDVESKDIEETTKTWEEIGEVSYLNLYTKLIERESKLLGLDEPAKKAIEHSGTGDKGEIVNRHEIDYDSLPIEVLEAIVNAKKQ